MPYILEQDKKRLDPHIKPLSDEIKTSGELNYVITMLLQGQKPKCYEDYNKLMGVLESCKLEFYRRAVAKYEDEKIESNTDVY